MSPIAPKGGPTDDSVLAERWRRIGNRSAASAPASSIPSPTSLDPIRATRTLLQRTRMEVAARMPSLAQRTMLENFLVQVEDAAGAALNVSRETLLGLAADPTRIALPPPLILDALAVLEEVCEALITAEELGHDGQ